MPSDTCQHHLFMAWSVSLSTLRWNRSSTKMILILKRITLTKLTTPNIIHVCPCSVSFIRLLLSLLCSPMSTVQSILQAVKSRKILKMPVTLIPITTIQCEKILYLSKFDKEYLYWEEIKFGKFNKWKIKI